MTLFRDEIRSPIGAIVVVTDDTSLRALDFLDYSDRMHRLLRTHYGTVDLREARERIGVRERLDAYFDGDLHALDVPTDTNGTRFQKTVWAALRTIAPGTALSYGVLARKIGMPDAVRAVGLANGANPLGIVVPCHRVIGADGSLTGYGGGLARKAWLLRHEGFVFTQGSHSRGDTDRQLALFEQ